MNYVYLTKEQLLTEIDNKSKAIINMGKQLTAITPKMEIFDFLFGDKNSTESLKVAKSKSDLLDEYLKKETEKLQAENKAWEIEFNQTVSSRQKAQKLEKENKLDEALSVYLQSIDISN